MHAIRFAARTYGEFSVVKNSYYLHSRGIFIFSNTFALFLFLPQNPPFFPLPFLSILFARHPRPFSPVQRFNRAPPRNTEIIYIYIYISQARRGYKPRREVVRNSPRRDDRLADPLFIVDRNSKTATWNFIKIMTWILERGASARVKARLRDVNWLGESLSWHASTCGMYTRAYIRAAFVTTPLYNAAPGLSQRFAVPFRNRWTDIATSL